MERQSRTRGGLVTSSYRQQIISGLRRHMFNSRAGTKAFWRYAIIGITQNAFFYSLTLLLLGVGWAAWQAIALMYPIATVVSFIANRSWAFGASSARGQFSKYFLLYGATYPVSVWLTWLLEHEGIPRWLATLITMAVLAIVFFTALRNWVFVAPTTPRKAEASIQAISATDGYHQ